MSLKNIPAFLGIVSLLILWQVSAMMIHQPDLFPGLTQLLEEILLFFRNKTFYSALSYSLLRGIAGFLIACIAAFALSAIAVHHTFWKSFFHPWIVVLRSIPVISIILIAMFWLSPPGLPVFIAFLTMFPILYESMLNGLENTDIKLVEMAKVYRKNTFQRFFSIYLPQTWPFMFSGMSTASGFGWRAVIIGEALANPVYGIGTGMKKAQAYINMQELLAWTTVAIAISFAFDFLLKQIGKRKHKQKITVSGKKNDSSTTFHTGKKELKITGLSKRYDDAILFDNFSAIFDNEHVYLLRSASGSGKTSLLNIIAGISEKNNGILNVRKNNLLSYSFQDLRLIPWLNIEENIAFALPGYPHISEQQHKKILHLINDAELSEHKNKLPNELSGGQQQRVALLRSLILPADILLLDEPLRGLDSQIKAKIIGLIESYISDYKPITIWATHEELPESISGTCSVFFPADNFRK